MHEVIVGPSPVNPDKERAPPPHPTLVYFPQNDGIVLQGKDDWLNHPPDLFREFSSISKLSDVLLKHLAALNITTIHELDADFLLPRAADGTSFVPPKEVLSRPRPASRRTSAVNPFANHHHVPHEILGNGAKAPDADHFAKLAKELTCDTEDAFRAIEKAKARPGHAAPHINHLRDFWTHLEVMAQYWDTSQDHYYDISQSAPPSPTNTKSPGIKRMSVFNIGEKHSHTELHKPAPGKKYKGRRTSCGSKMPEQFRTDVVRSLVRAVAGAFDCQIANPRQSPKLQIKTLLIPVTQNAIVWRFPSDKHLMKQGFVEGPLLGIQCRNETGFHHNTHAAIIDIAREAAGLLLLAQERARETQQPVIPGQHSWWVTHRRWGGGPGGEFGEKEQNAMADGTLNSKTANGVRTSGPPQAVPQPPKRSQSHPNHTGLPPGKTEESLWKELKPGKSLWEPRTNYLAVGKDREAGGTDSVFMVSSIYHHVAILRLDIHPLYVEFTETQQRPAMEYEDDSWFKPKLMRTRWYDLFSAEDRGELFRALWGVFQYLMRSPKHRPAAPQRQHSEASAGLGSALGYFKKKKNQGRAGSPSLPERSHSVG